jgi:hypothetical protein
MENRDGLSPCPMDKRRAWSMVERSPWPAIEVNGARPNGLSGARLLTGGGATGRGVHGESISGLTRAWAAMWRLGEGGQETVEEVLGAGSAWARREEKESGERCGEDRVGHHPFIGGRRGRMHRGFMDSFNASA